VLLGVIHAPYCHLMAQLCKKTQTVVDGGLKAGHNCGLRLYLGVELISPPKLVGATQAVGLCGAYWQRRAQD
jgi:hypothetical protein